MTALKEVSSGAGAIAPSMALLSSSATINALGDSISAQAAYFPPSTSVSAIPAWQASTAYALSAYVVNGGNLYRCTVAGTSAASGGPTGTNTSGIVDNTAQWGFASFGVVKQAYSYLHWVEAFSLGRLQWDMSHGYSGISNSVVKVIVVNGGVNYSAPTISFNGGATGTVQSKNGIITGVTITNPGQLSGSSFTMSLSDGTGSGAQLSLVAQPSGTFSVPGCLTSDMSARLPDVVASTTDIIVVHGGTNDVTANKSAASIIANLQNCYETLIASGKKVVAVPILPRTGLTNAQTGVLLSVNRWIRAYCRKQAWANAIGYGGIVLADPTRFFTDGTNSLNQPIGGSAAGIGAMTYDGLHPGPRGAQYIAIAILKAAQQWVGSMPDSPARAASMFDGYHASFNPGGNYLEGYPWQASAAYSLNQLCSNSSNIYICTQAGTTASSGGPTGTGSSITDGGAIWKYLYPQGLSVFGSGTQAMPGTTGSVTCSGSLAKGWGFLRLAGSSAGTITGAIENPWSDGQPGTRQSIAFSLGSGSHNEQWVMYLWSTTSPTAVGFNASDLGSVSYVAECEVEVSGVANLLHVALQFWDGNNPNNQIFNEVGKTVSPGTSTHMTEMMSSGEMLPIPNGGKRLLRTQATVLPTVLSNISLYLLIALDCSGAAGSATATVKVNHMAVRKAALA